LGCAMTTGTLRLNHYRCQITRYVHNFAYFFHMFLSSPHVKLMIGVHELANLLIPTSEYL